MAKADHRFKAWMFRRQQAVDRAICARAPVAAARRRPAQRIGWSHLKGPTCQLWGTKLRASGPGLAQWHPPSGAVCV